MVQFFIFFFYKLLENYADEILNRVIYCRVITGLGDDLDCGGYGFGTPVRLVYLVIQKDLNFFPPVLHVWHLEIFF